MGRIAAVIYKDRAGEWRWTIASVGNKKIMADGAEGYKTKSNCKRALKTLITEVRKQIEVVIENEE